MGSGESGNQRVGLSEGEAVGEGGGGGRGGRIYGTEVLVRVGSSRIWKWQGWMPCMARREMLRPMRC